MMKSANFTACGITYMNSPDLIARWNYSGPVRLIPSDPTTQITYEGCKAVCGTGNDWYDWSVSSSFITTWVLPMIGTLLQAPFESNAFWRTVKAICRWTGSPMSSLSYILWNIKVSGKCALFVDMAIPYDCEMPDEDSDFSSIRDSFYILMNLNQYKMKPLISMTKEAEGLLRIMLFGKDLNLIGSKKTLAEMRRKLAFELRSNRRRGVVPVFISTLWFMFSLGISIQSAFGYLGDNAQAHDLALGLFMSWFPILILCSIVDRNPVASDDIRRKINKLVDLVCVSLQDEENRGKFISTFRDLPESQHMAYWVQKISQKAEFIKGDYFAGFAGQARVRFHYGAAHAILIDIEKSYIAEHGRNWLGDERQARTSLVLGQVDRGLVWFDGNQFFQILTGFGLVAGTGAGAFILSYYTPTVGLSCRSGGYMIFGVVATALLLSELLVWAYTSPVRSGKVRDLVSRQTEILGEDVLAKTRGVSFPGLAASKSALSQSLRSIEEVIVWTATSFSRLIPTRRKKSRARKLEKAIRNHFQTLQGLTARQWTERCWFLPLEGFNTIWLIYLLMAQTTGAFVNCACQTSIWGRHAGYLDFTQWRYSNNPLVGWFWIEGTIISTTFMGVGIIYVVIEWCLQAHLSTEDYASAWHGLQRVRRFRRFTFWVRYPASMLLLAANHLASILGMRGSSKRKSLVWAKSSRYRPRIGHTIMRLATEMHQLPFQEPRSEPVSGILDGKEVAEPKIVYSLRESSEGSPVQTRSSRVGSKDLESPFGSPSDF